MKKIAKRVSCVSVKLVKEGGFLYKDRVCDTSLSAYNLFAKIIEDKPDEHLIVACLNAKSEPVNVSIISIGSVTEAQVFARSVIRNALLSNSTSVIIAHNHPSGDPTPSKQDINFTKELKQACDYMRIRFFDHLIIGSSEKFISLREQREEIFI